MKPFLIGLTGGVGSGKSTAAAELARLGAQVVSGDDLGREVLESSAGLQARIRERYGDAVFDGSGRLIRRALGERIFASDEDTRWLTEQTFPGIHRLWLDAVAGSSASVVVLDAALIFEWSIESEFDLLLIVRADRDTVAARLSASGRLSPAEAGARSARQIPIERKAEKGHVIVENNGTLEELRRRIELFWTTQVVPELHRRRVLGNASPA